LKKIIQATFFFFVILITSNAQWKQLGTNEGLPTNSEKIQVIGVSGSNLVISTLDNGIYISSDNGDTWRRPSGNYPSTPYLNGSALLNGKLFFGTASPGRGVYVTADNGETWDSLSNGLVDGGLGVTGNTLLGAFNGNLFLSASKFYISENEGQNWVDVSNDIAVNPTIWAAAYDGTNYYCSEKFVYKSTDGHSWTITTGTNLPFENIRRLVSSGSNLLAIPQSGGVYTSSDEGETWTKTLTEFASTMFEWNGRAYAVATWIYVSDDNGITWTKLQETGLQPTGLTVLNANSTFLFAGQNTTTSGSLWRNDLATSVEQNNDELATDFKLAQNYPNPFNPSTNIKFSIPQSGFVSLKIYDVLGNEIAELVKEKLSSGSYSVEFNADVVNQSLASGVYFYRLQSRQFSQTKKLMLIK